MKSFDALFAELSDKVAAGDPSSGTVSAVRDGVHAAGKKVVEEAAESWMAAEHEGPERTAEEISQLLYRVQVLMIARGLSRWTTSTLTSEEGPSPRRASHAAGPWEGCIISLGVPTRAARRRPEQGRPERARSRDARRERLPAAPGPRASWGVYDPENDTEFFYLRPRDIAIYVAAGTLDVGITGRDMLLETTPTDGEAAVAAEVMPLGFGRSPSASPAPPTPRSTRSPSWRASGSPRPTPGCCSGSWTRPG